MKEFEPKRLSRPRQRRGKQPRTTPLERRRRCCSCGPSPQQPLSVDDSVGAAVANAGQRQRSCCASAGSGSAEAVEALRKRSSSSDSGGNERNGLRRTSIRGCRCPTIACRSYISRLPALRLPFCGCFACCRQPPANVCGCSRPPKCRTRMLPLLSPPRRCLSLLPPSRLPECKLRPYFRPVVLVPPPDLGVTVVLLPSNNLPLSLTPVACRCSRPLGFQSASFVFISAPLCLSLLPPWG